MAVDITLELFHPLRGGLPTDRIELVPVSVDDVFACLEILVGVPLVPHHLTVQIGAAERLQVDLLRKPPEGPQERAKVLDVLLLLGIDEDGRWIVECNGFLDRFGLALPVVQVDDDPDGNRQSGVLGFALKIVVGAAGPAGSGPVVDSILRSAVGGSNADIGCAERLGMPDGRQGGSECPREGG